MDTTDTFTIRIGNSDLKVPLITPCGVPGVLYKPIVQASDFIGAITNSEHSMIYWVQSAPAIYLFLAISCINDATSIRMNILIICCDSDADRPMLLNGGLYRVRVSKNHFKALGFEVSGFGGRVKTVC